MKEINLKDYTFTNDEPSVEGITIEGPNGFQLDVYWDDTDDPDYEGVCIRTESLDVMDNDEWWVQDHITPGTQYKAFFEHFNLSGTPEGVEYGDRLVLQAYYKVTKEVFDQWLALSKKSS